MSKESKSADVALNAPQTCSLCISYSPTPAGNRGQCRRFPPAHEGGFPTVGPEQWCGEYKPHTGRIERWQAAQIEKEKKRAAAEKKAAEPEKKP